MQEHLRRVVALNFPEPIWISAEIAAHTESRGHHFLSLLEKGEGEREILAQADAVIWVRKYRKIRKEIGKDLAQLLQSGQQVRLKAKIDFHERFGLKLMIEEVDLAYSIGQLELQKRAITERLQQEQLIAKNRQITLPTVIQRIAVLSAENAAGWQDFKTHLAQNNLNYQFDLQLFSIALQGVNVRQEIIQQFKRIKASKAAFDAIVIIRGGGARLDLSAFDDYDIAKTIANFKLPILTGIGHEIDESIIDLVAHKALKTPTAAADFILVHNRRFEEQILQSFQQIQWLAQQKLQNHQSQVEQLQQLIHFSTQNILRSQERQLLQIERSLPALATLQLKQAKDKLNQLEQISNFLSLKATLDRGFALVLQKDKVIAAAEMLEGEEDLLIRFKDDSIVVKQSEKSSGSAINHQ